MPLFPGGIAVDNVKQGGAQVSSIWQGVDLVWPTATPPNAIIDALEIYVADAATNSQECVAGLFASGENGKILINPIGRAATYFDFSSDSGDNWVRKTHTLIDAGLEEITCMIYDEPNSAWYVHIHDFNSRIITRHRSTDDGDTWTQLDVSSATGHQYSTGMCLATNGGIYSGAMGLTNTMYIMVYDDPLTTTTVSNSISRSTSIFRNRTIINLGDKILAITDSIVGFGASLWTVDTALITGDYEDGTIASAFNINKNQWSMTDGVRAFYATSVSGEEITVYDMTESAPPAPYPTQTEGFGENIEHGDIGYSADIGTWLFLAPSTVDRSKILSKYSSDGDNWIGTQTLNITEAMSTTVTSFQVGYVGGANWIFAYRGNDTRLRLIRFSIKA